eukprot:9790938-Alexandrium_andersonii.AAC.1
MSASLVGSEMCIRDSGSGASESANHRLVETRARARRVSRPCKKQKQGAHEGWALTGRQGHTAKQATEAA